MRVPQDLCHVSGLFDQCWKCGNGPEQGGGGAAVVPINHSEEAAVVPRVRQLLLAFHLLLQHSGGPSDLFPEERSQATALDSGGC